MALVAVAIFGIVSMGFASLMSTIFVSLKTVGSRMSHNEMMSDIALILSNPESCRKTLLGVSVVPNLAVDVVPVGMTLPVDATLATDPFYTTKRNISVNGNILYKGDGTDSGNAQSGMIIDSIALKFDAAAPQYNFGLISGSTYMAKLQLQVSRFPRDLANSFGGSGFKAKEFNMQLTVGTFAASPGAEQRIIGCVAGFTSSLTSSVGCLPGQIITGIDGATQLPVCAPKVPCEAGASLISTGTGWACGGTPDQIGDFVMCLGGCL